MEETGNVIVPVLAPGVPAKISQIPARTQRIGFWKQTIHTSPAWIVSVGIHIIVLAVLALVTMKRLAPPVDNVFVVTIIEKRPELISPDIKEELYETSAKPVTDFSQSPDQTPLAYPGFLPKANEAGQSKAADDKPGQMKNESNEFLSYLSSDRSRNYSKVPGGRAVKSGAMGVGGGGGGAGQPGGNPNAIGVGNGPADGTGSGDGSGGAVTEARPDTQGAHNKKPEYPALARQLGQEGQVLLQVEVNENGLVRKIKVVKSSGYELLDNSALKAVNNWFFIPATKKGRPVPGIIEIPVTFKLV